MVETEVERGGDGLLESMREVVVGRGQMASGGGEGVPFIGRAPGPTGWLRVAASAHPCSNSVSASA
jgi:hypothetical protein